MMSDITKCSGTDCPIKESCWRFKAPSDEYQSVFLEIPGKWIKNAEFDPESDGYFKCDMFWGERQDDILNQLNEIVK